jgi:hypothetical protein
MGSLGKSLATIILPRGSAAKFQVTITHPATMRHDCFAVCARSRIAG